jgi:hypothetical protein
MIDIEARGPTDIVQYFAYRESSHRRKGAARHLIDWFGYIARLSQWGGGGCFACSYDFYLLSWRL